MGKKSTNESKKQNTIIRILNISRIAAIALTVIFIISSIILNRIADSNPVHESKYYNFAGICNEIFLIGILVIIALCVAIMISRPSFDKKLTLWFIVSICSAVCFGVISIISTTILGRPSQNFLADIVDDNSDSRVFFYFLAGFSQFLMVLSIGMIIVFAFLLERRKAKRQKTLKFPLILLYVVLLIIVDNLFFPTRQFYTYDIICFYTPSGYHSPLIDFFTSVCKFLITYGYCALILIFTIWILYIKVFKKPAAQPTVVSTNAPTGKEQTACHSEPQ